MTQPPDGTTGPGPGMDAEREAELRLAFEAIRAEIEKLRAVDLGETHPAVVFHPITPGRRP